MIDFDVAYDKLAFMESADEIAEFLTCQGVKAISGNPKQCAISRWLIDQTGIPVRTNYATVRTEDLTIDRKHPLTVREFLYAFDRGDYPELLDT